jgi:lipid-binding SYLF domain-containing protein
MKKLSVLSIIACIFGISTIAVAATVRDYSSTIDVFRRSPVVARYFEHSYGYAVFPTIGKAGYVIGGSYGEGQVYRGGKVTGATTVVEGSIGFQLGGKIFSEVIFFQDKRSYDKFTSGNFEFDATAQAVVITASGEAQAGSAGASAGASVSPRTGVQAESGFINGMATFVHTKGGLMYEFSIGGQKFTFNPL